MLYAAAAIIVLLGVLHSVLGERYLLSRLFRRSELPPILGDAQFTKGTLRFTWHLTTLLVFALAGVLIQIERADGDVDIVSTIGWTMLLAGLLPIYFTRGRHLSWIGMFGAGALCLWWAAH